MRTGLTLAALLIALGAGGAASAQSAGGGGGGGDCKFSQPINESYEIEKGKIPKCILQGKDPPKDWIARGGMSQMMGAREFGGDQLLPTGLKPSNSAVPHYESAGCGYIKGGTKPGGKSDGGSRDGACNGSGGDGGSGGGKGSGSNSSNSGSNSSSSQQQPPPLVDPSTQQINCLISVTGSVDVNSLLDTLGGQGDGSTCVRASVGANLCGVIPTSGASGQPCSNNRNPNSSIATSLPVSLGGTQTGPAQTTGPVTRTMPNGSVANVPSGTTFTVDRNNVVSATQNVLPKTKGGSGTGANKYQLETGEHIVLTPQINGEIGLMPAATSESNPQYNGPARISPNPCASTGNLC